MQLTGIIKKAGDYYVALCLELNVSSQGESIEEARGMLQEACEEFLSYIKAEKLEEEIRPAPLEVLREFLIEDVEHVRPSHDWVYSETSVGLYPCRQDRLGFFSISKPPPYPPLRLV